MIHKIALRWLRTEPIAKYIEQRRAQLGFVAKTNRRQQRTTEAKMSLSRNYLCKLIQLQRQRKKSDILMKLADLQRMKSDENKDEPS